MDSPCIFMLAHRCESTTLTGHANGRAFTLHPKDPQDALRHELYTLNDLKALQDWVLQREFKRVPGIIDVTGFGGMVKRYEVRPDPALLQSKSLSLNQVQNALASSNQNVGADVLFQGPNTFNVRGVGLFGRGADPAQEVLGLPEPAAAARHLRTEEAKR